MMVGTESAPITVEDVSRPGVTRLHFEAPISLEPGAQVLEGMIEVADGMDRDLAVARMAFAMGTFWRGDPGQPFGRKLNEGAPAGAHYQQPAPCGC